MEIDKVAEKDVRINKEIRKLKKIFRNNDIDEDINKFIETSIENIAFMKVELEDLQAVIKANGCVDRYQNGERQYGFKDSAAVRAYNSILKNFTTLTKTLAGFLPSNNKKATQDNLGTFLMK